MPSRRSFLETGVASLSIAVAGCSSLPRLRRPDGTDWTGSVPTPGLLRPPVTTEGIVVAGGRRENDGEQGRLVAFDAETGAKQWNQEFGRMTGLTAADGSIYVGEKRDGDRARIRSLEAETGTRRWTRTVSNLASAMTVADDTLYTANGTLTALATADGSHRWERTRVGETDFTVVGAPDDQLGVDTRSILFGDHNGVVALAPSDGSLVWRWNPEQWDGTTVGPLPVDETIYVGGSGSVVALDRTDGSVRWRTAFGRDAEVTGLHVTESTVLVAEKTDDAPSDSFGTIYELSLEDGSERYELRFDTPIARAASTATTFVVGTTDGTVTWTGGASFFDRSETTLPTDDYVLGAAGTRAFAQTDDGTLWALSPPA